jgi:hypothetical protein
MSNLLRRLAAHHSGTLPRVRPMASLPYQGAPAFVDEAPVAGLAQPAETGAPSPAGFEHAARETTARANARTPRARAELDAGKPPDPLMKPPVAPPGTTHAPPHATTPAPTTQPRSVAASPRPTSSKPSEPTLSATDELAVPTPITPPAQSPEATEATVTPTVATARIAPPARRKAAETLGAAPSPLLPSRTVAPQAPTSPARPTTASSPEPNEVHVHIGRIEVTAVHEAPTPRSRPRRGQAPMSLDDYLAKRQRGEA